jgi:hypothetical protein
VIRGTKSTGRFVPAAFKYNLKVPTLQGVSVRVKKAFDKRVDALVAAELAFYAKAALTQDEFDANRSQEAPTTPVDQWLGWCQKNFRDLSGRFTSSLYQGRYASVVVTFSGVNAPCVALGGLWVGYQTDRSVTIDTKTGAFKSLRDFTSNTGDKVSAAVEAWYAKESHAFLTKRPAVGKALKVCDRPGNVITVSPGQAPCFPQPSTGSGLVSWMVQDKGLRLTFPAGEGPRYVTVKWSKIPVLT